MGTRCNVVVKYGASKVYLYRHWDGYPAECGAALVEAIQAAEKFQYRKGPQFVASLLALRQEKQSYETEARPHYELTEDLHGDIEHLYEIKFLAKGVKVWHAARARDGDWNVDVWSKAGTWYDLKGFVGLVNADRAESNQHIAKMKAVNPGNKAYQEIGEYEMLAAA